jgi:molybdopterin-guanine dinucleotide biosynthesis protein
VAIVVVGGHTRNIGKTSVVAGLIAALPQLEWTAFKVTQFGHGICSANGEPCDCETDAHTVAVTEEHSAESGTDSARFLAAGAVRSYWVRTRQGQLAEAMPRVRKELARAKNAILESNSIVRFLKPDLYLTVLDPTIGDFKPSAQYFLDRADAVLWSGRGIQVTAWRTGIPSHPSQEREGWGTQVAWMQLARSKPQFFVESPAYTNDALTEFVREKVAAKDPASIPG